MSNSFSRRQIIKTAGGFAAGAATIGSIPLIRGSNIFSPAHAETLELEQEISELEEEQALDQSGSPGSPPVRDSVIVGGRQSPSSTVYRAYSALAPGCTVSIRIYIRWYVTQVNGAQVLLDRIYFSFRPNVNGTWYGYRLWDGNRVEVQTEGGGGIPGFAVPVSANTSLIGNIKVNKWINWGRNKWISVEPEYSATRTPSNTPAACGARLADLFALELR